MNPVNRADRSLFVPVACEELEGRRLLAASAVLGADGLLRIEGTPRNDDIVIAQHVGRGNRLRVDVTRNGTLLGTFLKNQVKGVTAFGGLGDDSIGVGTGGSSPLTLVAAGGDGAIFRRSTGTLQPAGSGATLSAQVGEQAVIVSGSLVVPMTLFGGGGNDTLVGGDGDDRLEAGSGDDVVYGEGGDDVLLGQNDDDVLKGGGGADTLHGGDGDDALDGDASAARVLTFFSGAQGATGSVNVVANGGSGTFTVNGGGAGGTIIFGGGSSGSASDKDVLIGGDGSDRFHRSDKLSEYKDRSDDDRVIS